MAETAKERRDRMYNEAMKQKAAPKNVMQEIDKTMEEVARERAETSPWLEATDLKRRMKKREKEAGI